MTSRLEELHSRREANLLKKLDQKEKYNNIKRMHQENMLVLRAKHFGFDVKNKIDKASLQESQRKNVGLEHDKKNELSLNYMNNTYQIRPKRHLS